MMTFITLTPNTPFTSSEIDAFCATLSGPIVERIPLVRDLLAERGYFNEADRADVLSRLSTRAGFDSVAGEVWP